MNKSYYTGFLSHRACHGSNMDSFKPILKKMKKPNETDEMLWFYDFVEARRKLLKSGLRTSTRAKLGTDACCGARSPSRAT